MHDATPAPLVAPRSSDDSPAVRTSMAGSRERALATIPRPGKPALAMIPRPGKLALAMIPRPGKLALPDPWRGAARDYVILVAGLLLITAAVFVIQG